MKRIFLALLVLNLNACSSMQAVSVRDMKNGETPAEVRTGDRVEVTTRDREKFEFTVTEINTVGLGGKFGFIPYQNMAQLRVRRPGSNPDDFAWLWAVLGLALAVGLIASADSIAVCSPGPCPPPQ